MKGLALIAILFAASACAVVIDRSMRAVDAADYTLMMSACEAVPGRGMDICRVKEGQPIDSFWRLIVPRGTGVLSGELTVYGKDISKTFPITSSMIEIPWREIFSKEAWERSMDGELVALAQIRWKNNEGIEEIWNARGIAKVVVTRSGYDPLALDSGFEAWKTTCKISYTTAGRSAIQCH